jgi:predicted alpha/beta hydrolase
MLTARAADGVTLHLARVTAQGRRRGVVLCTHAMMTDGRYLGARRPDGFAATLAAAGLDVYVLDFRGHGRSVPPRPDGDGWTFDDLVDLDLPAAVDAVSAAAAIAPTELAILGHSLGGLATCAAIGTGQIAPPRALVLAATSVWLGGRRRRALMGVLAGVTDLVGRAPIRALRVGTADESPGYVAQLTGWARTGRWTSRAGVDYLAALGAISTPTYGLVGAGDWMCRPADAAAILDRVPRHAPLRVVGRAHGDGRDADHFSLLTDPTYAPRWHELADWIDDPRLPLPATLR